MKVVLTKTEGYKHFGLLDDLEIPGLELVKTTTPAEVAAATGDTGESEPGMEGLLKGPYVAETYPVTVEHEYVVVEIGR